MKTVRLIFGIFLCCGVVLLAIGVYTVYSTRAFIRNAATAPATVIENIWSATTGNSGTYHPRIRFRTIAGRDVEFVSNFGSRPPSYRVNEAIEVIYDPENPAGASINSFWSLWFVTTLLLGMGAVFSIVGIVPFALERRSRRKHEWLRSNGSSVQADLERVELNTSVQVNGTSPYRIVCQWLNPMTNQVHVFKSENLWFDPSKYVTGNSVQVLIDPDNPRRYWVETGFLPKIAE